MKIIRFYANWCRKCGLFSDKKNLKYDFDVDIDLPSQKKSMIKYQISVIPTFVAVAENGRIIGKLSNPTTIDDYFEWKERLKKR